MPRVVWLGDAITKRVPLRLVHLISAGIFAVLGVIALSGWGALNKGGACHAQSPTA